MLRQIKPLFLLSVSLFLFSSCEKNQLLLDVVPKTPISNGANMVGVRIESPNKDDKNGPIVLKTAGLPLGIIEEEDGLQNDTTNGQSIRIVIDGKHKFLVATESDELDAAGQDTDQYFETTLEIDHHFSEGPHMLRVFPVRSWGEIIRDINNNDNKSFAVATFGGWSLAPNESPYLTYSEPSDLIKHKAGNPILLDFYLSNVTLSEGGHYILLHIEGQNKHYSKKLSSWTPYLINGLASGNYSIKLSLHESSGREIPSLFSGENSRTITVE